MNREHIWNKIRGMKYLNIYRSVKGTEHMKRSKKYISFTLIVMMISGSLLQGCKVDEITRTQECPYDEYIVVDVFDNLSNYQGLQSGWFGKVVKDKFNMELNIIAPNIAGGGDTMREVRAAAGNLGDLIISSGENGLLQNMVNAGLLYNMEDDLVDKDIMEKYGDAIHRLNDSITPEGIYAIPSEVSSQAPDMPSEGLELVYGPYLRWDLYAQLGYPEMETIEDILPVLKQMQELSPVNEDGDPVYAFSFFKDWDANMMNAVKQPCCFYGYDEYGFVLAKADGSDYQNILDEDSLYIRICKLYFEANQMGLVDPESPRQKYEDCFEKIRKGRVLFSFWPWMGQSAYNTLEHTSEGKGFMLAPIDDLQIYSYACNYEGNQQNVIAIGSQAQDPQRLADFIDWLYSDEGIHMNGAQLSGSAAGPEGLTWEMTQDGPCLTEFGKKAMSDGDITLPEEYGGGTWEDGTSALNYKAVAQCEKDSNGYYYAYELWDSTKEMSETALLKDWKRVMKADSTKDYLYKNNMMITAPASSYQAPAETSEQVTIRSQCKKAIQDYSWKMVYARNEVEFYNLLKELKDTVYSYGYEEILEYDLQNAKDKYEAGLQAVKNYYESKGESTDGEN